MNLRKNSRKQYFLVSVSFLVILAIVNSLFVMVQGIIGALGVRVPIAYFMSFRPDATLFEIGLATPISSVLQLILCLGCMLYLKKRKNYNFPDI